MITTSGLLTSGYSRMKVLTLFSRSHVHQLLLALTILLAGCSGLPQAQSVEDGAPPSIDSSSQPYLIGVGDSINVHVWREAELTMAAVVRPDGYISMPLMGDLLAEGRQPEALAEEVKSALSSVLREPVVTVIVTNPSSREYLNRVRITGQVGNPSSVQHRPGMTVLDLVLQAGGINDFGAGNRATLQRNVQGEYRTYKLDINAILEQGDLTTNYVLAPGDVISVPRRQVLRGEF